MSLGKQIRLSRLFNPKSGRIFVVAFDHGINRGVLPGIEDIGTKLATVVNAGVEAVTLNKGIASKLFPPHAGKVSLIMKASGFSPFHKSYDVLFADVEEAVRLGADAISVGVIIGDERQPEMLKGLGMISKEAQSMGMPLVAHIYPAGNLIPESERYSAEHISYCARVGAELGVDIVKTWYTGSPESFAKVVEACPTYVVVAGGPKMESTMDLLKMTYDAVSAGASGVTYGRNVWQHDDIPGVISAVKAVIHKEKTPEEAAKMIIKGPEE